MMVAWDYIYISKSQVLLMGDFNLDLLKIKKNQPIGKLINSMLSLTLYPLISKPNKNDKF